MSNYRGKAVAIKDPPQPDYTHEPPAKWIKTTRRRGDVLCVAGHGAEKPDVVFAFPTLLEEDAVEERYTSFEGDRTLKEPPQYCKGLCGGILRDLIDRSGINATTVWYTAVIKWLLPKNKRLKPTREALNYARPSFMDEIRSLKPKLVVCMGKQVFDLFCPLKIKADDIKLGVMYHEELGLHYVLVDPVHLLALRPDFVEKMSIELQEVAVFISQIRGHDIPRIETSYQYLRTRAEVVDWIENTARNYSLFAVDCEWGGNTFVDGTLRTIQFSWLPGTGVAVVFRAETGEYTMDASYEEIGALLGDHLNRPEVKYVGHHFSADSPWQRRWLNLETYQKCVLDTEFAQQTLYEHVPLGLDNLTMMYTDMGKYDLELILWKKANPLKDGEGYAHIPDSILLPYACLAWDSLVQLGDGTWERIHKLVQTRYTGTVKSLVDGKVVNCVVTNWKKTKHPDQKWWRLMTPSTRGDIRHLTGPRFTEDHEILTDKGFVRVDALVPWRHKIATGHRDLNTEQRQIILGSLLGDGGLRRPNTAGVFLRFSQSGRGQPYAQWKADSLSSVLRLRRYVTTYRDSRQACLSFESSTHVTLSNLLMEFERSGSQRGHFRITEDILEQAGDLGLAVWVMDDSTKVQNTLKLYRSSADAEEISAALSYFRRRFGKYVTHHKSNGVFVFSFGSYWRLMDCIKPYMHPAMAYKHAETEDITTPYTVSSHHPGVAYECITGVLPADRPGGNKKMECFRYCLTVPEAGNFLTKAGFVSNCKDTDATLRIALILHEKLVEAGLWNYYRDICNPFVTDVFTEFAYNGLPVDIPQLDELRELYMFVREKLEIKFRHNIHQEAKQLFVKECIELRDTLGIKIENETILAWVRGLISTEVTDKTFEKGKLPETLEETINDIKQVLGPKAWPGFLPFVRHLAVSRAFNLRSGPSMKRWLFDVKRITPVKSTKGSTGFSMAWEKVMALPPELRKEYQPATDKQSLQIFGDTLDDKLLRELLDLNAVGNILKAFLKPAEYDDEGELVRENGLKFHVCSDSAVHPNTSLTESGRPRSWSPNVLNSPSQVNKRIATVVKLLLEELEKCGQLPDQFSKYLTHQVPSVRSCFTAPPGWCIVESDFKGAENVALAYASGDEALIRLVSEPDTSFAVTKDGKEIRLHYEPTCPFPPEQQKPEFLMAYWFEGKLIKEYTEDELLRDEQGKIVHPASVDLHWSLAETMHQKPREILSKKADRDGSGKTGNFSCFPADTVILTNRGKKRIVDVDMALHKVWDGLDWVSHEGIIHKGYKRVFSYDGLRATADHMVWTSSGEKREFGSVIMAGLALAKSADKDGEATIVGFENNPNLCKTPCAWKCRVNRLLYKVWGLYPEMALQLRKRKRYKLRLPEETQSSFIHPKNPISGHAATLQHVDSSQLLQLQGTRYSGFVQGPGPLRVVGTIKMAWRGLQREGFRSGGQRRTLFSGEFTPSRPQNKFGEYPDFYSIIWGKNADLHGGEPTRGAKQAHHTKFVVLWEKFRRYSKRLGSRAATHKTADKGNFQIREDQKVTFRKPRGEVSSELCDALIETGVRDRGHRATLVLPVATKKWCGNSASGWVCQRLRRRQVFCGLIPGYLRLRHGCCLVEKRNGNRRNTAAAHQEITKGERRAHCAEFYEASSEPGDFRLSCKKSIRQRSDSGGNSPEVRQQIGSQALEAALIRQGYPYTLEPVYDLLNAGPRHRFTANGVLVSNCAYGASENSIERKIESDTGIKPEPGTGAMILEALAKRQPVATKFLEELQELPKTQPYIQLQSGRRRHFLGSGGSRMRSRDWDALMASQGREARNIIMQESVGATSARACIWLLDYYRKNGMKARPMVCLYDAICTLCPMEERSRVKSLHQEYMTDKNTWTYHERELKYPIDTDYCFKWSTKPTPEQKALLYAE